MFVVVRDKARAAEQKEATDRRTWAGAAGGFLGGAVAGLDPSTSPWNFATLPIGGAGKSAFTRIISQGAGQGAIEAVNQVTGVQEQRELLGLNHGFLDAASRVVGGAVGGAALQGAGEALVAGGRRFFRSTPSDPAPAPEAIVDAPQAPVAPTRTTPEALVQEARTARLEQQGSAALIDRIADETPLSGLRTGKQRVASDLFDMERQLNEWTLPAETRPRTAVAAYPGDTPTTPAIDVAAALENNARYQAAKAMDPVAFTQYEKLLTKANSYRRWIGELSEGRDADVQRISDGIDRRLDELEARLRTTQGKNAKAKIRREIDEVRRDRQQVAVMSGTRETRDIAQVRRALMKTDEQMRDLAPNLGRAYARAEGRWGEGQADLDAVWQAYRAGRTEALPAPATGLPDADTMMSLYDRVPTLQRAPVDTPADKPAADVVREVLAKDIERLDEAREAFSAQARALLSETADGKVRVEGVDHEFSVNDKLFDADGQEVTIRDMLEDINRQNDELEAITSCSIR